MNYTKTLLNITIALFCVVLITIPVYAYPDDCSVRLSGCIESYSQQTLIIPKNVNTFLSEFNVCNRVLSVNKKPDSKDTLVPSVMFLIDNSNSMIGLNTNLPAPRDSAGRHN